MPRPVRPWFRFYTEAVHDPKLRRMTPTQRWVWVAVLAAARQSHTPGVLLVSETQPMDAHDLADFAAVPVREVRKAIEGMEAAGMLAVDDAGAWRVTKWNDRQFETDNTTERTRKHRSNSHRRNVPNTSVGTPPETETETETVLGGDSRTNDPPPNGPPPRRCSAHIGDEHPPACGACADARRTHVAWLSEQANGTRPGPPSPLDGQQAAARARAERHLRAVAGEACQDCADTGMRLDEDGQAVPCNHQESR